MAAVRAFATMGARAAMHMPRCAAVSAKRSAPAFSVAARRCASTFYLESHEYVKVDGSTGTVGISDFAQQALGDVVYVELPSVGDEFEKGESFGSVESVKAASDVYSPLSGEVIEINEKLSEEPGMVNSTPEGDAWFIKLKLKDPSESKGMMDPAKYKKFCDDSKH